MIGSAADGIVLLIGGQLLVDPIGAPKELLWVIGVVPIPYAVAVWRADWHERTSQLAVQSVVGFNVVWTAASLPVVVLAWLR